MLPAYNERVKKKRTIRYLYLLYAFYGLSFLAYAVVGLFAFLINPEIPNSADPATYKSLFYAEKAVIVLVSSAYLAYGVYGIVHTEGRTKAAYYVPLWFGGVGDGLLFILDGLILAYCSSPETSAYFHNYWLMAHFLDPMYLLSFVGAILLIKAYQKEDKGRPFLKWGYTGLAFLLPLFVYDLVLFSLDMVNLVRPAVEIAFGTVLYALRLTILILAFFALQEADE
jgi:hypothetical protein